jgi:dienelactone hydrolase
VLVLFVLPAGAKIGPDPSPVRRALRQILDRPAVALNPEQRALPDRNGLAVSRLSFTSEPGQVVPALVVQAKTDADAKWPVVIVLHGTGGFKEQNLPLLEMLARRGFIAVAPDGRFHGERCAAGKGTNEYFQAIGQAYIDGKSHPWLYDTAYDVTRLIDCLTARPDVDAARIGILGFSKGGMECYLTAAADSRVAVAVPCIAVQGFAWELANDQWQKRIGTIQGGFDLAARHEGVEKPDVAFVKKFYDRLVPGIADVLDGPSVLPTICPRPLLVINGQTDGLTPLPSVKLATDAAAAAYKAAGAAEKFVAEIEPGTGHEVKPAYRDEAIEWLVRWLKPSTPAP